MIGDLAAAAWIACGARASTYFVDPSAGADGNHGDSPRTAWRTPPGTRTPDDGAFAAARWGAVAPDDRIRCGDVILLKPGGVQTAARGGAWRIDPTFYDPDCPDARPVTIRVAGPEEWPGVSSSPFTVDGSGVTGTSRGFGGNRGITGLVEVCDVASVRLGGAGPDARLVLANAATRVSGEWIAALSAHGHERGLLKGFEARWVDAAGSTGHGIAAGDLEDFAVRDCRAYDNRQSGFMTGYAYDRIARRGAFVDCEAFRNGADLTGVPADGFVLIGGEGLWCVRCDAHDNEQRGFNSGEIRQIRPMSYRFRELAARRNGRSWRSDQVVGVGFGFSGDDRPPPDDVNEYENYVVGAVVEDNPEGGGWLGYGAGSVEVWHGLFRRNGRAMGPGWGAELFWDRTNVRALVRNSVVRPGPEGRRPWLMMEANPNAIVDRPPDSDHNVYVSDRASAEFSTFTMAPGAAPRDERSTFSRPPAFVGRHDRVLASRPAGAPLPEAADAGAFLMRTAGNGQGVVLPVRANGGSADPRHYFIAPDSFLRAEPDEIMVEGCGPRRVVELSATAVTLDRPCSWRDGAGVHLPWTGAGPDAGPPGR